MGYSGKQVSRSGDIRRFNFTGNGSNTAFDLGFTPATQNQLIVTVNGLVQHYDAFSISGSTINFTGTPASGDTIQVTAVVDAVGVAGIPDGAIANVSTLTVSGNTTLNGILTATANVNIDSGTLFVDGTNNRVGINNTAPTSALTVTGAATFSNSVSMTATTLLIDKGASTTTIWSRDSSNSQFAIDHQSSNTVSIQTNHGSGWFDTIKLNPGGRVTLPYQPSFRAYATTAQTPGSQVAIIFNNDSATNMFNVGSHYNTSNGRFTAPVTGVYVFQVSLLFSGQTAGTGGDTAIYKNGASVISFNRRRYTADATGYGSYLESTTTNILKLTAGDYITVVNDASSRVLYVNDPNWTHFAGWLLG